MDRAADLPVVALGGGTDSAHFTIRRDQKSERWSIWLGLLSKAQEGMRPVFITSLVAMLFFSRLVIADELRKVCRGRGERRAWLPSLGIHLMLAVFWRSEPRFGEQSFVVFCLRSRAWWLLWAALAFGAFTSLESGVTTRAILDRLDQRRRLALSGSVALACVAVLLGNCSAVPRDVAPSIDFRDGGSAA